MLRHCLPVAATLVLAAVVAPSAQSDLDALMQRVLARRDENWKKLQQYTLNEEETLRITALGGVPLYGFERDYLWFPRAGFFIRSPLTADGVAISEEERRREEERWLRRARRREERTARDRPPDEAGGEADDDAPSAPGDIGVPAGMEDIVRQSFEPQFIRSANFLRFKFDEGQYALVGRERMLERDVLRIEYYPTLLFREGRTRPNRELREDDHKVEERMNKVSLVTLWVDPAADQILQYEFENIDFDFLPGRSIVRIDGTRAGMRMGQPFPGVWLPESLDIGVRMTLAVGEVEARYRIRYRDYRLPEVTGRVR